MKLELLTQMNDGPQGLKILGLLGIIAMTFFGMILLTRFLAKKATSILEENKKKELTRQNTHNQIINAILHDPLKKGNTERYFGGITTRSTARR